MNRPARLPEKCCWVQARNDKSDSIGTAAGKRLPDFQKLAAFVTQDTRDELDFTFPESLQSAVGDIQLVEAKSLDVADRGPEVDSPYLSPVNSGEAHDTGFGGRVDLAAFEVRVAYDLAGPNDGADLGVTGGIAGF